MNVSSKHAYRNGYLKSDKWRDVRLQALVRTNASCQLCGFRSLSNDAHHVFYPPSFWDTTQNDLVILCRFCHDLIHTLTKSSKTSGKSFKEFRLVCDGIKKWMSDLNERGPGIVCKPLKKKKIKKEKSLKPLKACCCCKLVGDVEMVNVLEPPKTYSKLPLCPSCATEIRSINAPTWNVVRGFLKEASLKRMLTSQPIKFN